MERAVVKTFSISEVKEPKSDVASDYFDKKRSEETEHDPVETAKSAISDLASEQVRSLLMEYFSSELESVREKAREEGFEEGKKQGEEAAQEERNESLKTLEGKSSQLEKIIESWSENKNSILIDKEEDCLAIIHKVLSILMMEHLKDDHRIACLIEEVAINYVDEEGVKIHLNKSDYECLSELDAITRLPSGWEVLPDASLSPGSHSIKSKSGVIEFLLDKNFEQVTEVFKALASEKAEGCRKE